MDNGSSGPSVDVLQQCEDGGASIIELKTNLGIGYALNLGCRFWLTRGRPWILTFDQDSKIGHNFIESINSAIDDNSIHPEVAMFAPVIEDYSTKRSIQSVNETIGVAITSGSCIRSRIFKEIGYFDDFLFIDYVDFDFCIRLRKKGYTIKIVKQAQMIHSIGRMQYYKIPRVNFGFTTTNHSAVRRYYKHRNFIFMIRKYSTFTPIWLAKQGLSLIIEPLKIIIAEDDKVDKLKMIYLGWRDGIIGRGGKYYAG